MRPFGKRLFFAFAMGTILGLHVAAILIAHYDPPAAPVWIVDQLPELETPTPAHDYDSSDGDVEL